MSFGKDMKAKIDELQIERHLKELVDETEKTAAEAVEKAGGLAHERRDEIVGFLDKATERINEQTKGQYAEKVEKVRTGLLSSLDKLASRRRLGDPVAPLEQAGDEPPGPVAADSAGTTGATGAPGATVADGPSSTPWPTDPVRSTEPETAAGTGSDAPPASDASGAEPGSERPTDPPLS